MKELSITTNLRVRTYLYNAYVESIISNLPGYEAWFHNNYIQLAYYKKNNISVLEYLSGSIFGCVPMLKNKSYEDIMTLKQEDDKIHEKFQAWIESGSYIYTFLDEFYVPERSAYSKFNYIHDVLIYGYDTKRRVYMLTGYNYQAQYVKSEINFDNMIKAFQNDSPCLIEIQTNDINYSFNFDNFKTMLVEYRNGSNSRDTIEMYLDMDSYNDTFYDDKLDHYAYYGIQIYEGVLEYLSNMQIKEEDLDYRMFYLIYEHKKNMKLRMDYLIKVKNMRLADNIFDELINKSQLMLNVAIKYKMTFNPILLDNLKRYIWEIQEEEKKVLDKIIGII
ncbi:hypothetical protein acsn021_20330 [Anaerocolumna cellulosilytica]|uniref:Uncharacterized protein n=1 Tax=Anaerocolumna cellulosilytica TaxID=433286 RepID=A0A6S6QV24_9FIRM|nr:hypothetical protein [Anaerocolumna cellulosilytica]MBB5196414.1 hypothetical protein [Anaerocolumna cellulosilytica]BCJ94464.1 hypothetical protein acsn021_20330 [Anaerocolumna cellulosilytica]